MKLFIGILFVCASLSAMSQGINSSWSDALDKNESEIPRKIFPNADSGYSVVKRIQGEKASISIDILDSLNVLSASSKILVPGDKIIKIAQVNNKITIFSVQHNLEKKSDVLSAYTLNSKGELSGTTLIASLQSNGGYLASYKVAVSNDGNKVGVICEKPYKKDKTEEMVIKILDQDLKPVLTKNYSYTFPSLKRRFNVPMINNNGSLYIVKRIRIKANNKYFLTLVQENGVEHHHDLKLRSMRIADLGGAFNEEGDLILSGFYAGYSSLNFEGVFTFRFNESITPVYKKEFMLSESLIHALMDKKEISKLGNGLSKFHVKEVIVTNKNSSYLIAEHVSVTKNEKEYIDTRKGLAVIKFTAKGDFLWGAPVRMDQVDKVDKGYWSSSIAVGNDKKLYVMYNAVGEGLKKPEEVYGKNALVGVKLATVDINGNVNYQEAKGIFSELSEGVTLNTKSGYLSDGKIIIVAENKERSKGYLGELSLQKKK